MKIKKSIRVTKSNHVLTSNVLLLDKITGSKLNPFHVKYNGLWISHLLNFCLLISNCYFQLFLIIFETLKVVLIEVYLSYFANTSREPLFRRRKSHKFHKVNARSFKESRAFSPNTKSLLGHLHCKHNSSVQCRYIYSCTCKKKYVSSFIRINSFFGKVSFRLDRISEFFVGTN